MNHRYLIDLRLPHSLYKANDDVPVTLVPDRSGVPNIHCKVVANGNEFEPLHAPAAVDNDGGDGVAAATVAKNATATSESESERPADAVDYHYIKVEYFAHREKLLREELKLINSRNDEELLKLVITARVLGKGKGTPMLRNGIHCLGFEGDEDTSEQSDVPGCSGGAAGGSGH